MSAANRYKHNERGQALFWRDVGRNNFRGNITARGARVSEILYTLFHSAKLSGVEPGFYLEAMARHAKHNPGGVLLPWELAKD